MAIVYPVIKERNKDMRERKEEGEMIKKEKREEKSKNVSHQLK